MAKREIIKKYREASASRGGVYRIINRRSGWLGPLVVTVGLSSQINRFLYGQISGICPDPSIAHQWNNDYKDLQLHVYSVRMREKSQNLRAFRELLLRDKNDIESQEAAGEELQPIIIFPEEGSEAAPSKNPPSPFRDA